MIACGDLYIMEDRENGSISTHEMNFIAKEIQEQHKTKKLAQALGMPQNLDAKTILNRWQKNMTEMKSPITRLELLFHLLDIDMQDLHDK